MRRVRSRCVAHAARERRVALARPRRAVRARRGGRAAMSPARTRSRASGRRASARAADPAAAGQPALEGDRRQLTYAELHEAVGRRAAMAARQRRAQGERVAIAMERSADLAICILGAMVSGRLPVPARAAAWRRRRRSGAPASRACSGSSCDAANARDADALRHCARARCLVFDADRRGLGPSGRGLRRRATLPAVHLRQQRQAQGRAADPPRPARERAGRDRAHRAYARRTGCCT